MKTIKAILSNVLQGLELLSELFLQGVQSLVNEVNEEKKP